MQQQTGKKENATYNTSNKSNEIHNNDSNLIERTKIEGTPFTIITQTMDNDKTKSFIVMGDHRLTEPTNTEEESLQKLITENWLIITNIIAIITDKMLQQKLPEHIYETEESLSKQTSIVTEAINRYKENHPETKIVKV